jgi:uncharacterized protein (DUF302 family)
MKSASHPAFEAASSPLHGREAFLRGEATFGVVSDRPFDVICHYVEQCVLQAGMRVVHRHDLDWLLRNPTDAVSGRCSTFDVVDVSFATRLVDLDASLIHVLPWRICVHGSPQRTTVTTAMPSVVITEFTHEAEVGRLARRFESAMQALLRDVASRAGRFA